jgi:hypothetical protein
VEIEAEECSKFERSSELQVEARITNYTESLHAIVTYVKGGRRNAVT